MNKYLTGKSALVFWRTPDIRGVLEPKSAKIQPEYVVFTEDSLYRPVGGNIHTCSIKGAGKYVKNGVCTLPLIFLQLANEYNIHELIVLGLMICSWHNSTKALCSVNELEECALELKGHRGRRKALRAIRYLKDSSRSPREHMVYMFLRLPNAMGGCGISETLFNYKIEGIMPNGERFTYFADLYIPSKKLIIEYDSFQHHNNPGSFSEDSARDANLTAAGYRVIHITPGQMSSLNNLEVVLRNIARIVGKRIRIRARKFFEGFRAIWDLLHNNGEGVRDRHTPVMLSEVPRFPGVRTAHELYLKAHSLFRRYPRGQLTLS